MLCGNRFKHVYVTPESAMNFVGKLIKICTFLFFLTAVDSQAKNLDYGLSLLNEGKYKAANEIFRALSDKGNAKASYWLAYTQFKTSGTLGAGSSLLKAAEGGNPWAMATLAGTHMPKVTTSYCNYLGWPCDEKWVDKAIEGWERLAEEGDGKAMYALLYHDPSWWQYIPIYRDYRYGQLANKLYNSKGYTFFFDDDFWSWVNEDIRLKYLKKMAKEDMLYGAYRAAFIYEDRGDVKAALHWVNYGLEQSDYFAFVFKSDIFIPLMQNRDIGLPEEKNSIKSYFYCRVAQEMNHNHDCDMEIYFNEVFDQKNEELKYYDKYSGNLVDKQIIKSIEKKAQQRAKGHKANLYLDETTVEFFRGYGKNR
jgi:hypothetical protein